MHNQLTEVDIQKMKEEIEYAQSLGIPVLYRQELPASQMSGGVKNAV